MFYGEKIHLILSRIYQLRVLSYDEIFSFIFEPDNLADSYCTKIVKKAVAEGYLDKIGHYKQDSYYFLNLKGINFLKNYGIIPFGKREPGNAVFLSEYLQPFKIRIKEQYVKHQLALNHFVLSFEKMFSGIDFDYYDEIYISNIFTNIRPDGLLKVNNTFYFLEMDMNTEHKQRLLNKWENYRNFLNSNSADSFNYNIKVLFILGGNLASPEVRAWEIRNYLENNLEDKISPDFDVLLNTEDNLLDYINRNLRNGELFNIKSLFARYGFNHFANIQSSEQLGDYSFEYYMCQINENSKIVSNNGFIMEFFVDSFIEGNMYVYKKVKNMPYISSVYKSSKNRNFKYLVIVNNEKEAFELSKATNSFYENLFFTTINRLSTLPFNEAIFRLDTMGFIYHFSFTDLNISIQGNKVLDNL